MNHLFSNTTFCAIITIVLVLILVYFILQYFRIKKTLHQLSLENTTHQNEIKKLNKTAKNPLGNWISPDTRSLTLNLDKKGKIIRINDDLLKLTGYQKKELLNKNIYGTLMTLSSHKEPLETNIITRMIQNPKLYTEHETELMSKSGHKIWVSWTNNIVTDAKKKVLEIRSVGFDITKRKELETQLQFLASTDPETGTLNRQALLEIGTRELKRSIRYKHALSVLLLKITLLENHGLTNAERDQILKQVVAVCRATIRDVDYLGRIGEVEFCLILPETTKSNIPFLQKRLQEKIISYNKTNPLYPLHIQFGMASYTHTEKSIDTIIMNAYKDMQRSSSIKRKNHASRSKTK